MPLSNPASLLRKASTVEPRVLLEQRPSIACSGPSVAPSFDFNPSANENHVLIRSLVERYMGTMKDSKRHQGVESPYIENKEACIILADALPAKKSVFNWESPLLIYLATGGLCPSLSKLLSMKKSYSLPCTIPLHLIIKDALKRPANVAVTEPCSTYYRSILRRCALVPSNIGSQFSVNSGASASLEDLPTDVIGSKEWAQVEAELGRRFGAYAKVTKHVVTHSSFDVMRLAIGFAAGLRSRTFSLSDEGYDNLGEEIEAGSSSDEESDSCRKFDSPKRAVGGSHSVTNRSASRNLLLGQLPKGSEFKPDSLLEVRIGGDANIIDPTSSLPHSLYKQTDKVLGKVRPSGPSQAPPVESVDVLFETSLGIMMTPGIESLFINLGCPAADVVPIQIDPTSFTAESLCSVLRHAHFSTMVVDDTGFDLLARAHDLWRRNVQRSAWPIRVVITSSVFEECGTVPEHVKLISEIQMVDLDEVIVKNLALSLSRLLKFRAGLEYSIAKVHSDQLVHVYPRVIGMNYCSHDGSPQLPLWSGHVMCNVAGLLALEKHLDWSVNKQDVVMMTRIEIPCGDSLDVACDLETSATYYLGLVALAVGGRVAQVPLSRLMFQCHAAQDSIRKIKPTIAVGSNGTWALFAKRLAHEAGIDGAINKSWKGKVYEKRCSKLHGDDFSPTATAPRQGTNKHAMKELFFRKCVDPFAFRQGRQLLGSAIRLAFVVEPLDGQVVMHEKSMSTISMLLSSSSDMKVVHGFSTTGLGGVPFAFLSSSCTPSSTIRTSEVPPLSQAPSAMEIHTGDPLYNERCTLERRVNLCFSQVPKELVDSSVSAPAIGACVANPSLDFMLSGVDESTYPMPGASSDTVSVNDSKVTSTAIVCRLSRAIRLSNASVLPLSLDASNRVFVKGGFAQMQDGMLSGPVYPRVCLDSKMRSMMRFHSIANYLQVHCFHILKVKSVTRLAYGEKNSLISSSAARSALVLNGRHNPQSINIDLDIELNPLAPAVASREAQRRASFILMDYIRTRGVSLQRHLTGSVLTHFALLWPQGLIPSSDVADDVDVENFRGTQQFLDPDTRQIIEQVLSRHGSNLTIDTCRTVGHGLCVDSAR